MIIEWSLRSSSSQFILSPSLIVQNVPSSRPKKSSSGFSGQTGRLRHKFEERTLGFVEIISPNSIPNADWKVHLLCRFDKFQAQTWIRIGIVVGCFPACCNRMVWFFSQVKNMAIKINLLLVANFIPGKCKKMILPQSCSSLKFPFRSTFPVCEISELFNVYQPSQWSKFSVAEF